MNIQESILPAHVRAVATDQLLQLMLALGKLALAKWVI